ncbi:MAG: ATP-binding protein [bacterium]|nr:ATP-binding protein [bacterium]
MRAFRDFSIKHKLTWIIMLTSSIALVLACMAFLIYDRITYKEALVWELRILADIVGANSTAAVVFENEDDATETLAALKANGHIVAAAIYRTNGEVFARYSQEGSAFVAPEPQVNTFRFGENYLELYAPIVLDGERVGTVYIRSDLAEMAAREQQYATIVVVFLLVSSLVAFLLTARLQRIISNPISRLTQVVRHVSESRDYGVRAQNDTQDEIGVLFDGFNEMLRQIQQRDAALQRANDQLEVRVEERTRDLQTANAQLLAEITERQRTEAVLRERDEQLRQSQKLEAIGRLAGGVAHDFNNQLAIIRGYVDMTLDDLGEASREYHNLSQISKAVQRSASLTDQLLMFSSRQPVNMRPLDLNRNVKDLQKMLGRLLGEDIEVEMELEESIWAVSADSGNIDQVITNLSVNARDAMPEGGTLKIRTHNQLADEVFCRKYAEARPGRFICLSVQDAGVGMTDEVQARLFEPFFTTKGPGKGTGLGLSVVYGIVQAHAGWVAVESKLGQGSCLSMFLPVVEQEVAPEEVPTSAVPLGRFKGHGERVLVVEDEPALREMTAHALADQGYIVQSCSTVMEATDVFRREIDSFDLVLSDVGLPDGRGTDMVFDFLQKKPGLAAILVTGYTDERAEWDRARDAGLLLLQKPVPMSTLLKHVQQVLHKNKTGETL